MWTQCPCLNKNLSVNSPSKLRWHFMQIWILCIECVPTFCIIFSGGVSLSWEVYAWYLINLSNNWIYRLAPLRTINELCLFIFDSMMPSLIRLNYSSEFRAFPSRMYGSFSWFFRISSVGFNFDFVTIIFLSLNNFVERIFAVSWQ